MPVIRKHCLMITLILFIPIGLLLWLDQMESVYAASLQADQISYLPLVLSQPNRIDIAITEVITPAAEVMIGDVIDIGIVAENVGNLEVMLDIPVVLTDTTDLRLIGSQVLPGLGVRISTTVTIHWDTATVLRNSAVILDNSFESGGIHDHILTAAQGFSDDNPNNDMLDTRIPLRVWQESSTQGLNLILNDADLSHIQPHSGEWAVWLGGFDNEASSISQPVTIPANNPTLVYWYWIQSDAIAFPCDSIYEGEGGVKINNIPIGPGHRLCGDQDTGWVENRISLNDYAGQNVILQIYAQTPVNYYFGGPSLYIDDVTIESE